MLRLFPASARIAALSSMMLPGIALAVRPVPTLSTPATTIANKSAQKKRYKTPADMVMIPFMKAHAGMAFASALSPQSVQANDASGLASPNFGGYINAPSFAARNTASMAQGIFDTGMTVELTADFNKDGKPDLATFQEDGTLNILIGDGAGNLAAPVSYVNPNQQSTGIFIASAVDVNGDGNIDIVAYDYVNNAMITWINLGNGTFNAAVTSGLNSTIGYANSVAIADVNKDGKADIVYNVTSGESAKSTTIYLVTQLGVGDGTFSPPVKANIQHFTVTADAQQAAVASMAIADINGDGKMDVALGVNEDFGTTGIYFVTTGIGNGDGSFSALGKPELSSHTIEGINLGFSTLIPFSTSGVYLQDVNGDGKIDIISDQGGILYTAPGGGDGTFGAVVTSNEQVSQATSSAIFDVNGDGKPDFVTAGGTLAVMLGNGDGTFAATAYGNQYIIDPAGSSYSVVTGDFNGDSKTDVAFMGGQYQLISLFFGNGTVFTGAPAVTSTSDTVSIDYDLATTGKYTASGYASPIVYYNNYVTNVSNIYTLTNDGKGNFKPVAALAGGWPKDLEYIEPFHADFNNDGLEDFAYANATGEVLVALSKGDGTFSTPKAVGIGTQVCPEYYADAKDINGDGFADLVIPYGSDLACGQLSGGASGYWVALGKGDGTFSKPVFTTFGTELYSATLADMNGDGVADLILNDAPIVAGSGYQVSVLPGNGDSTFGNPVTVESSYVVTNLVAADINNDGKNDLVLSAQSVFGSDITTGGIITILGNGDGTFNLPSVVTSDNWFYGLQVADMNNDGNQDIVATLYNHQGQAVDYYGMVTLLGYGNGLFSGPYNQFESLASQNPQVGSFYADGAMDVMTETGYGTALFAGQGGSTLSLTPSAAAINVGDSETLTATVKAALANRPTATGTVSFYDGTTLLGTGIVNDGTSTFSTSALAVGSHIIKAVYPGDSNFNSAISATTTVLVVTVAPAFTVTPSATTITVTGGSQGIATLNLAANSTFSGAVTLACSGMPANGTCVINPGSVSLAASGRATATLVLGTTADHAELKQPANPWEAPASDLTLAAVFCFFLRRRKRLHSALRLVILLSVGGMFIGCSSSGNSKTKSALTVVPGTYSVTIAATPASGSSAAEQTTTVSLTVN
jgi:hypothetical protein